MPALTLTEAAKTAAAASAKAGKGETVEMLAGLPIKRSKADKGDPIAPRK